MKGYKAMKYFKKHLPFSTFYFLSGIRLDFMEEKSTAVFCDINDKKIQILLKRT